MTISPFIIYIIGILDKFHMIVGIFLVPLFVVLIVAGILYIVVHLDESFDQSDIERAEKLNPIFKKAIAAMIILGCLKVFVPNTGLVAAMYVIPAVVNNEKVQNIGSNLLDTMLRLSDKWMIDALKGIEIDEKDLKKSGNNAKERDI